MKKLFIFTPKMLLIVTFLFALIASFFQLNPAIDTGRELYIPLRMLNGEVLYRDIVNIYGSLAYQINTLLYMVFGVHFNVVRIFGIINATLIIWIFMLICGEIFPKKDVLLKDKDFFGQKGFWQFAIIPFMIGVCSVGTFNYTLPYSFAMTYGLSAFLASVLFTVKFVKNYQPEFAYIACLFAGMAVACKYDFFLFALFLFVYILVNKKISTLDVFISFMCLVFIPFLSFGILFIQGMQMKDLQEAFALVKAIGQTHSLKYFYSHFSGAYPCFSVLLFSLVKTLILFSVAILVTFAKKWCQNDKFLLVLVYAFALAGFVYVGFSGYSLLALCNTLIFGIFYKKIVQNRPLFIFMCSSILFSLKTFYFVNIDVYGTYTMPLIILSIAAFLFNINFSENVEITKVIHSFATILLVGLLFLSGAKSLLTVISKMQGFIPLSVQENTNCFIGATNSVFAYPQVSKTLNEAIEYIQNNTKNTDSVVVVPETMYLNFVTKRPADNIFDSLTPLYFEVFGEEFVINHFEQTRPEYFILNNRDTSDYGRRYICLDYGKQFCRFVEEKYTNTVTFGDGQYVMKLYKRKDL